MKKNKKFEALEQYDFFEEDYIHEVEKDYAPEIGLFLVRFSSLEYSLNVIIASLVNNRSHEVGFKITEKLSSGNKIDLFYNLLISFIFHCKTDKEKRHLFLINDRLKKLNSFRNILAHANWHSLNKDGMVRCKTIVDGDNGVVKFEYREVTIKLIKKAIIEIEKLDEEVQEFFYQVYNV